MDFALIDTGFIEKYVDSLEYLLSFTASTLKTLHVALFDSPAIGQLLSQHQLPSLKNLLLYSTSDGDEYDIGMICTHSAQLSQSGTRLEQLELQGWSFHAEDLPGILSVCPYVEDLILINFDLFYEAFPTYQELSQFPIRKLRLGCEISDENLPRIAEFIVNSPHVCEVHFTDYPITSINTILEAHKLEFGRKIKSMIWSEEEFDANAVWNVATYCPNIESLDICIGNNEAFSPLGEFLVRSRCLKHITVRTWNIPSLEGNSDITKFIESAQFATCPVETIELHLVPPTPDEVCKLIGSFANSLKDFKLTRFFPPQKQNQSTSIEDTAKVVRFLEKGYNFPNLKSISLPVPNTDHLDDDEEEIVREITCLLSKLEIKIESFDSGEMIRKLADRGPKACSVFRGISL